jgi:hypothetical protein
MALMIIACSSHWEAAAALPCSHCGSQANDFESSVIGYQLSQATTSVIDQPECIRLI